MYLLFMLTKYFFLFLMLFHLTACSEQPEALPRVNLSQLNSLEQEDLKKELLSKMREKAKVEMKKYSDEYLQLDYFFPMCYPSLPVRIQTNLRNEMMFNSEPATLDQIPLLIHRYFTANRLLSQEEIQKIIDDQQMPNYRFPLYAKHTRIEILEEIKNEKDAKIHAEQAKNFDHGHFAKRRIEGDATKGDFDHQPKRLQRFLSSSRQRACWNLCHSKYGFARLFQ